MITNVATARGVICLFASAATHLVVDVEGYFPGTDAFLPLSSPARLLDTSAGHPTFDGRSAGEGPRPDESVYTLQVATQAGIPSGAAAVVLNVTVDEPNFEGYVTVFTCEGPVPDASHLNYARLQTIANAAFARLSPTGTVCVYTSQATELIVDVAGSFADTAVFQWLAAPSRLLDSRFDPVPPLENNQVHARIDNYDHLFEKDGGRVRLHACPMGRATSANRRRNDDWPWRPSEVTNDWVVNVIGGAVGSLQIVTVDRTETLV